VFTVPAQKQKSLTHQPEETHAILASRVYNGQTVKLKSGQWDLSRALVSKGNRGGRMLSSRKRVPKVKRQLALTCG
jgi:hypothetical protein